MKRNIGIFAFVFFCNAFSLAQAPQLVHEWSFQMTNDGMSEVKNMCMDNYGFVYVVGQFSGTVDFDPSDNNAILSSAGEKDVFIAKYDSAGNCIYAKGFGGASDDDGRAIAVDNLGNVYVIGDFYGTADFDPSEEVVNFTSQNLLDIYFAKFDADGNYVFAKVINGNDNSFGCSIVLSSDGGICISGYYSLLIDFDPSENEEVHYGAAMTAYVAKYDNDGNYIYAHSFSQTGSAYLFASIIDDDDNILITGTFSGIMDFDTSDDLAELESNGGSDIFIAKYDSDWNYIFAVNIGGANDETSNAISLDSNGNIIIGGYFYESSDFDPSGAQAIVHGSSQYDADLFVAKYDSEGNYIFAVGVASITGDWSLSVASDNYGNTYVTGVIGGDVDFDPSDEEAMLYNDSELIKKIFFAKYDQQGNFLYVHGFDSDNHSIGQCVLSNELGEIYLAGRFGWQINFGEDESSLIWEESLGFQGYLAKFTELNIVVPQLATNTYGTGTSIQIPFAVAPGIMEADNTFFVELSDAIGGFGSPMVVGSSSSTTSGYISMSFPDDLPPGLAYRLRIRSTAPVEISNVISNDIEIVEYFYWYLDSDGDAYVTGNAVHQNESPEETYRYSGILGYEDCDDTDPNIWQATEVPVMLNLIVDEVCDDGDAFQLEGGHPLGGQWSGQGVTAGMFDPQVAGIGEHEIFYTAEGDGVCIANGSAMQLMTVEICSSVEDFFTDFIVFPTLTNSFVTVKGGGQKVIDIIDLRGRCLNSHKSTSESSLIDMSEFADGLYLMKVTSSAGPVKVFKIIKSADKR